MIFILQFSRQYSRNEPITFDWLCQHIGWPFNAPETIMDLVHLESVFDVMDLYLWLSYRFQDLFPDSQLVRATQGELDGIIQLGVFNITKLLKKSSTSSDHYQSQQQTVGEDGVSVVTKRPKYLRGRGLDWSKKSRTKDLQE